MKQLFTFISLLYFSMTVAQERALAPENPFPEDRFQYDQEIPPYRIPDFLYPCEDNLLEVMFAPESAVRLRNGQLTDLRTNATQGLLGVLNSVESFTWMRQSDVSEAFLDKLSEDGARNTGQPVYNLNNIYRLEVSGHESIWELGVALESLPGIIYARPVPKPQALPLPPNYQGDQGYLDPADEVPSGINALYAWTKTGGTGTGITICDLEYEWNYNHADVTKAVGSQINTNLGITGWGDDHGTAVIGQMVANNNGWGVTGASYGSGLRTCGTFYGWPVPSWNVSGAITLTIANLSAGDVILLEQQWDYTGSDGFVPIEWWGNTTPNAQTNNPVYAAIVNAVANGIHVVQAGGNGNVNTGNLTWFGNSGSVIVGAGGATAALDRRKLGFSSYGPRFDAQGWGHNVTTTGYGGLYNAEGKNYWYTSTFNGTSSASPIVASAIACFGGYWRSNVSLTPPSPSVMRTLLHRHGQLQVNPGDGNIGRRPDLKAMIDGHKYCAASGTTGSCFEYISRVQMGTIDNLSGCNNYVDYTSIYSTNLPSNLSTIITVTNGFPGPSAQCAIWVDWNRDGDFSDANETIAVSGTPGNGPFTATIAPPAGVTTGEVRVRVRVNFTGTMSACGTTTYGEVEDYTLNIQPAATLNVWTGVVSTNWHTAGNWSLGVVPNSTFNVEIPAGTPHQPAIGSSAECNYLYLNSGATLTHSAGFLDVYGTMDAGFGQYTMSGSASLYFMGAGNVNWWDDNQNDTYTSVTIWKSNADAKVTMRNNMTCSSRVNILTGKLELSSGRTLSVTSTATNALQVSNQGTLILSPGRTLDIAGQITFSNGSNAEITGGTIKCGRNFRVESNTANDIIFANATLIMNGNINQFIQDLDGGAMRLHNLTVDKSGGKVFLANDHLTMTGSLLIENGTLSCFNSSPPTTSYNMTLAGNWTNNNFPAGFEPGDGRVIFNGPGHQLVNTDENFNILEANMVAALRVPFPGQLVTCNTYHWTSGGIDVFSNATFTALDLSQQGITGGFWINPGGVINLYQDNVQWIDLDGDLYFNGGGTINIYGGNGNSWWAFSRNASLNMNGGVLDFKDNGITISNSSYTLNAILSEDALIRTTGGLSMSRPNFEITNGTFEFYGSSDRTVSMTATNRLNNILVNKSSKEATGFQPETPLTDPRSGELLTDGTRANALSLSSDISIYGNMTIQTGTLNAGIRTINIGGDWTNNVGEGGFNEGTGMVNFNGLNPAKIYTAETFYNFNLDKTYFDWECLEIMSVPVTILNNLNILDGNLEVNSNSVLTIGNNVNIANGGGLNVGFFDNNVQVFVGGNWTNSNTLYDTFVGYSTSGNETITFNGSADQIITTAAPVEDFGKFVISKPGGAVRPTGNLQILGNFEINSGNFISNVTGLTHRFHGDFTMNGPGNYNPGIPSTTAFNGENNQVFLRNGGSSAFNNVLIDKAVVKSSLNAISGGEPLAGNEPGKIPTSLMLTLHSDMVAFNGGTTTVNNGALNLGGKFYKSLGAININDGGILYLPEGSLVSVVSSLSVNSGGLLECKGTSSNKSRIYKDAVGFYTFEVNAGGTISAEHTIFEHMAGPDGINIRSGALIDPVFSFNHCTFRNGDGPAGSALLVINNNQDLTITGASFPTSSVTFNVAKDINQGNITFVDFSGSFAGEDFDWDIFNRVHWFVPELSATPLLHNVDPPAGSVTFNITSNLAWTISESVAWLTVTPMLGSNNAAVTINYTQNSSSTPRSGIITISAPGVPDVTVTVNQAGATLAVTPSIQNVTAPAGSTSFSVGSNTSWTVTESIAWLSVLPMSGTGNGTLNVSYNQNTSTTPRSGQITVSSPGLPNVIVTVNQAGIAATLTVTPANRDVAVTAGSTTFSLNSNTGWAVSESVPWLSVTPASGTGNGTLTVNYGENATGSTRVGSINVTATGGALSVNVTVTQVSYPTHSVSLNAGWQGLSSYIMPASTLIANVFAPVAPQFIIAQTMTGMYYPDGPVNTIGNWVSQSAYRVKMSAPAVLPVIGNEETNKVFSLSAGWNLVPVIVNAPLNPVTLFSGTSLTIAKDVAGTGVYWPAYGINTLGNLLPGRAYYALLGSSGSITFPANSKAEWTGIYPEFKLPANPWNEVTVSSSSHLIAIEAAGMNGLMPGDVIGIFAHNGECYGVTEITSISDNTLLTAYADDALTGYKDGFDEMEPMTCKVYRPSTEEVFDVEVEYNHQLPQTGHFTGEGLSAIKMLKLTATGVENNLGSGISIYPNPTDGMIWISGISEFSTIEVIGTLGTTLYTLSIDSQNTLTIDLDNLQPGVYQVKITGEKGKVLKRVVKN